MERKSIHHRGHGEHRGRKEKKRPKEKKAEVFDRKSPPFAQNAKDGAPSSPGVGWRWKGTQDPVTKPVPGAPGGRKWLVASGEKKTKGITQRSQRKSTEDTEKKPTADKKKKQRV